MINNHEKNIRNVVFQIGICQHYRGIYHYEGLEGSPKVRKNTPQGEQKSEPIECKNTGRKSQKGVSESPQKPSGAKRVPRVSQRVTKIMKESVFGKGREKGAKMMCKSYEVWLAFGAIFY